MSEERQLIDGKWMTEEEAIAADAPVCTRAEFEALQKQVGEIHEFVSLLAAALNNPMLKAMIPPQYRGMLGG